ncbi:thiamine phosphate synthase [Halorhodospira abdelmalekii]|uniref:thiamine phosphate synthase n=1 Tax=Halorhodospira abdelmalekii TaxID=421629 RepID=UPI001905CBCC|nr:thiamine phosphate synthase [Halorhodospira abdelmalekii]MBK1734333.1 thiamine phosphate synthase [Halorhodospira abdelmalekii]
MTATPIHGIYAVTAAGDGMLDAAAGALRGGVRILQYRDKGGATEAVRRHAEAEQLRQLCSDAGALLIINDDIELAAAIGAAGVHLGREDGAVAAARARLGRRAWIGVSCYADRARVDQAVADGADYIALGSLFPSVTKPEAVRAPLEWVAEVRASVACPIVAIGGIEYSNIAQVAATGVDAAAVVSAIFDAGDPEAAAAELVAAWQRAQQRP